MRFIPFELLKYPNFKRVRILLLPLIISGLISVPSLAKIDLRSILKSLDKSSVNFEELYKESGALLRIIKKDPSVQSTYIEYSFGNYVIMFSFNNSDELLVDSILDIDHLEIKFSSTNDPDYVRNLQQAEALLEITDPLSIERIRMVKYKSTFSKELADYLQKVQRYKIAISDLNDVSVEYGILEKYDLMTQNYMLTDVYVDISYDSDYISDASFSLYSNNLPSSSIYLTTVLPSEIQEKIIENREG